MFDAPRAYGDQSCIAHVSFFNLIRFDSIGFIRHYAPDGIPYGCLIADWVSWLGFGGGVFNVTCVLAWHDISIWIG